MTRVPVPEAFDRTYVAVAGTHPDANEERVGPPREEHIRVDEQYPRNLKVREGEDGNRFVGAKVDTAVKLREFFAEEYGAEYDDTDGAEGGAETTDENTGDGSDGDDAAEDGSDGDETPTCGGNDGACSREVDEPGGLCWQHE